MILLKFYFCFISFIGYTNLNNDSMVVVIGHAQNAKAGAIIISKNDEKMYYLDGLDSWNEKVVEKLVRVSGYLIEEKTEPQSSEEPIRQQMIGLKRIIRKPKWEFIK